MTCLWLVLIVKRVSIKSVWGLMEMSAENLVLSRIFEISEPLIFAAYAVVGWLLFRIFGPEEVAEKAPGDQVPEVPQIRLVEPAPVGELSRH